MVVIAVNEPDKAPVFFPNNYLRRERKELGAAQPGGKCPALLIPPILPIIVVRLATK